MDTTMDTTSMIDTWVLDPPTEPTDVVFSEVAKAGLWKKGVLTQIQSGIWSMETKLEAGDIGKNNEDIPGFVRLGRKQLMPSKAKSSFTSIVSNARAACERYGFNFILSSAYFIPFGNFDRLKGKLDACQKEFYQKVDRFLDRYASYRDEYLEQFSEYRDRLESHYPDPEYIRPSFKFNAFYYSASIGDIGLNNTKADDLYVDWAVGAMNSLRSDARVVSKAITDAMDAGNFNGRTMRRVQTLIDRLQNMDMMDDLQLRNSAMALVSDPTQSTAKALAEAAVDVKPDEVRRLLLG